MDRDSRVVWRYGERVHHDFDVGPDGRVYALVHRIAKRPVPELPGFRDPFIDDFLVVLSPEGREVKRLNLMDVFRKSPFRAALGSLVPRRGGDLLHTNTARLIDEATARRYPFLRAGQVLVSFRDI
jgi:hypothetical protein